MRTSLLHLGFGVACAALLATTSFAAAEMISMKADLKGTNEVPPNKSAATGSATVTYDTATKKMSWKLTYSGLSGPARAAHFHGPAPAGKNAGVVVPIANTTSGAEGSAPLSDAQAKELLAGNYYVNVHTAANPGGEIRGQVVK